MKFKLNWKNVSMAFGVFAAGMFAGAEISAIVNALAIGAAYALTIGLSRPSARHKADSASNNKHKGINK